ncbi:unnamed protein product, partial [Closterium sp. NIES-65]
DPYLCRFMFLAPSNYSQPHCPTLPTSFIAAWLGVTASSSLLPPLPILVPPSLPCMTPALPPTHTFPALPPVMAGRYSMNLPHPCFPSLIESLIVYSSLPTLHSPTHPPYLQHIIRGRYGVHCSLHLPPPYLAFPLSLLSSLFLPPSLPSIPPSQTPHLSTSSSASWHAMVCCALQLSLPSLGCPCPLLPLPFITAPLPSLPFIAPHVSAHHAGVLRSAPRPDNQDVHGSA